MINSRDSLKLDNMEKLLTTHMKEEEDLLQLHHRAIFGDVELGEQGMKAKVDEMHDILKNFKGANRILSGGLFSFKTLVIIVGIFGIIKGWWISLVHYAIAN